jgi:hypothetical protein
MIYTYCIGVDLIGQPIYVTHYLTEISPKGYK